jgi:hypothetical protein
MSLHWVMFILFGATYGWQYVMLLQNESAILLFAAVVIFLWLAEKEDLIIDYSKEEFRWIEMVLFYTHLKNTYQSILRHVDLKLYKLYNMVTELHRYSMIWISDVLPFINTRELQQLAKLFSRRLRIASSRKKREAYVKQPMRRFILVV